MYSNTFINKCIEPKCSSNATYSKIKNSKHSAIFCNHHNKEGYFSIHIKYCIEKDCRQIAKWGFYGQKDYCYYHKKEDCETVTRDKHGNVIKIDEDKFKI